MYKCRAIFRFINFLNSLGYLPVSLQQYGKLIVINSITLINGNIKDYMNIYKCYHAV